MNFLIDTHCHLDYFDESRIEEILLACAKNNVCYLQTIATEVKNIQRLSAICDKHNNISCSIGAHPDAVLSKADIPSLEELMSQYNLYKHNITAVGEIGLDFSRNNSVAIKDLQIHALTTQVAFAQEVHKPLIIHARDAEDEFATISKAFDLSKTKGGVMHCFTGSKSFMYKMLDLGYYISLSGIVTFKNATQLQDVAKAIPKDRLIIETDSPYLAPVPMRGKPNEPAFIIYTAQFLAELLSVPLQELIASTTANAQALFNFNITKSQSY